MIHPADISHALLAAALAVAVVTDVRKNKVYNWLTWPAIVLGIVLGAVGGPTAFVLSLKGLAAGLVAGLVFMVFFRSGAGDAKLLMVVGVTTSWEFLLGTVLYGAIAAFPMALVVMWRRGVVGYTFRNLATNAVLRAAGSRDTDMAANTRAGKMPYALAIAAGAAITFYLSRWAGMAL